MLNFSYPLPCSLQYSGTNAEFTKADPVIFRSDLYNLTSGKREFPFRRTLKYDAKWLESEYPFHLPLYSVTITRHYYQSHSFSCLSHF